MPPAGYPAFLQYLQSGRVSRVRAPYDNLDPAVKPLQSPESAVYIMDSLLGRNCLTRRELRDKRATNCYHSTYGNRLPAC